MKIIQKALLCVLVVLNGCMVGPNYVPPEVCVPNEWEREPSGLDVACECEPPRVDWWNVFSDPLLSKYIEMGAFNNQDLHAAEANIMQAIALRQVAASGLFPQISTEFNATRTYFSKNGPVFSIGEGGTNPNTGLPFTLQIPQMQNIFNLFLEGTWTIDLFGKIRRGVEAADAEIGSAIEQRNDLLISILAEIANNYMEIRSYQQRGILIEKNISLLEQNAQVAEMRFKSGYTNLLDLKRIEAELAKARADLPEIMALIYRGIYALSVLTGQLPECLLEEMLPIQPLPSAPAHVAVGLRSDLLRRRPDVRVAERELAAATANIGVAVASFFPTISLGGNIGLQSLSMRNLFQSQSKTWSISGDVLMPIFQGGLLIGNLRATEAATAAAAFNFQQAVLNALEDAESALISYSEELERSLLLTDAVEKYRKIVQISNERYTKGLINLIDLLDTEREYISTEEDFLDSETTVLLNLISLYKALGGGWEPIEGCAN